MPTPTTTAAAVLGLLRLRTWTTYELAKQVQKSLGWFWPRAERKLYEEPKRLVADGLATAAKEMTGARPKTVYAVTPAGRKQLRRWLDEAPVAPTLEFEGMVKVFFADAGSVDQLRTTLTRIAETSDERMADLEDKRAEHESATPAFPERLELNKLALQFQLEHERVFGSRARWALEQTASWETPTG